MLAAKYPKDSHLQNSDIIVFDRRWREYFEQNEDGLAKVERYPIYYTKDLGNPSSACK